MPIRSVKRSNVPEAPKTLSQVIEALSMDATLTESRRRDLVSACNSFARLVGRQAHDIPSDVGALRNLIASLHHVQGRITKKRLANIRADLAAALQVIGVRPPDPDRVISASWIDFLAKASAKHQGWAMARFARFCSARQIEPAAVNDEVLEHFKRHLDARVLTNDPVKIARDTAKNFNVVVKRAGLGFGLLNTARGEHYVHCL